MFLLLFLFVPSFISAQKKNDGFQSFYTKFRSAINKKDKAALKGFMASRLTWYQDGELSREEVFRNIGQASWSDFWRVAKKAVAQKAKPCKKSNCENRSGYYVSAGIPSFQLFMLFEKTSNGNWYWTGLLGD